VLAPRSSFLAGGAVLLAALPVLAIPRPPPTVCPGVGSFVIPATGNTIPANVPGLPLYLNDDSRLPRTLEYHDIQLRDDAGALVPHTVAAYPVYGHVIRPGRELAIGEATLTFLEDCPLGQKERLATPVRNEGYRYTVAPASPFPTRIGAISARVTGYRWHPAQPEHPSYPIIRFELQPTPELYAFRATLELALKQELKQERSYWSGSIPFWPRDTASADPNVLEVGYGCDNQVVGGARMATLSFELTARLPGADQLVIPSLPVTVEVDCSERPDPDAGASEPAQPRARRDAGARDSGADQVQRGGGCSYLPTTSAGFPALLAVAAAAIAWAKRRFRRIPKTSRTPRTSTWPSPSGPAWCDPPP
jgi:hypothetical protein